MFSTINPPIVELEDSYQVDGMSIPKDPANRHYKAVQASIQAGAPVVNGRATASVLKAEKKAELAQLAEGHRQAAMGSDGPTKYLVYDEKIEEALQFQQDPSQPVTPETLPWMAMETSERAVTPAELVDLWVAKRAALGASGIAIERAYVQAVLALEALPDDDNSPSNLQAIKAVSADWPALES